MRNLLLVLSLVTAATLVAPWSLRAQSEPGHIYQINEFRAYPGMENAYGQSYHDFLRPIWTEVVRRGGLVAFTDLWKQIGDATEGTHLIILEYESWDQYSAFTQVVDAASRAVTGRPWAEISAQEFVPLRELLGNQVFAAPPGGM